MLLNDFQIAELAFDVGWTGQDIVTAVCVALAESGGYTDRVNTAGNHPASRDRGLWQINDFWHPEVSDAQAFDPVACAMAAHRVWAANGWHAWVTYTSGSYLQFTHRATIAARVILPGQFVIARFLRLLYPQLRGVDVAAVQHALGPKYYAGTVDGVYGPMTTAAVQRWQHDHHLTDDGIVGPQTAQSFKFAFVPGK